jgi:hypothetical protein
MENAIRGQKFRDDDEEEVIEEVKMWLQQTPEDFNQQGMNVLVSM